MILRQPIQCACRPLTSALTVASAVALLAAVAGASTARAQSAASTPPFTIRQALSAPFPTELVTTLTGGSIAWVFDAEGVRNVWIAQPPAYVARQITHFTGDQGWDIGPVRWIPDGSGVVFVRGTAPNSKGEYPNPALDPHGTRRVIMRVSTDGTGLREIAEGSAPQLSPDGHSVAFSRAGNVWLAPMNDTARASQLFVARGRETDLRWSPDGSGLAYTSQRGDHSFVGVYSVKERTITYLDPSVDRDGHPAWSRDSHRVAFLREAASTRRAVHAQQLSGVPWSIRVADVRTGQGTQLWRASSGAGSVFHQIASPDQLLWSASERIVFPWERSGWTHLYAIPAGPAIPDAGGMPTELTPGPSEVASAQLDVDAQSVVYASNQGDIDRQHIRSVPVTGGTPVLVTPGRGIEWSPVPIGHAAIALLRSDAVGPPRPAVVQNGSVRDIALAAIPADFPAHSLVQPEAVLFSTADDLTLHGQIFRAHPSDANSSGATRSQRRPAVIFFHGGSRRQMLLGWNQMSYYSNAYALNQYLASRGYIVLSVNYRGGTGYGLGFREAAGQGPLGGSEERDIAAAVRYLKSRPDVDASRVGVWGGSYGGYMTALALARYPADFVVGVDFAGVHDWNLDWPQWIDTWDQSREAAGRKLAYESSPMFDLSRWRAPVLLIQGDDDQDVAFAQTVQLTEDLRSHAVPVETMIFPDEMHDFLVHAHWVRAYEATAAFLERYLKM